ncbi:2-dehydropantoate 2-reductase [Alkalihalobacillus alcalophilus ATCC 27647 = CGMCC 1.3604]|uniref:2-dehydropantoate 2-reductase n=1 Tax=Alkalihalobacillus alcalophilus ATCC 27647 = CGMCC 1.3604 TaxID=1218173 RepID=A0A094WPM3_ALKAL|nr:ketopantoate reductase family protein [Alkalihalobacillus alcalophilus]KGA97978.1 2-dehydropantoate 2-reductase [Alkalihalobacillus alcalophilus ATCC 27647 = CGMCC 1.3604]MED1563980.1 ketopantoate reductase family protein [Alkalihalobacillus alcalophilus]THG89623.1 2-dehydropantoate 2-reductase [Alkalihalobacillus alcalophilus ATCC 27647 = CGMCC 1.3604]
MKIVIIGAGALGAYFGSRLEEVGENVTYLVREKRAAQIRKYRLKVSSPTGNYQSLNPQIIESPTEVAHVDLVILAVKGQHLQGALEPLKMFVEKGAKVLPLLNGIEHIPILQNKLGEEVVLGGLSFIIATLSDEGHVIHSSEFHDLIFGPLHPSQIEFCQQLDVIMEAANFHNVLSDDISFKMWEKYMFISSFSGITTATNLPIGPIREQLETFSIAKNLLKELKQLANEYGVYLSDVHVEEAVEKFRLLNEETTSSMHQDRRKGLTLEVDHLHGGALRLAKEKELQLPYTETILAMIKPFEKNRG